jgi:hypothetical protein
LVVLDSLSLFLTGQEKETSFFVLVHSSCPANSYASIVFPVDLSARLCFACCAQHRTALIISWLCWIL